MSSTPTSDEIWKDARWLAQAVDPRAGLVRLVEMTSEQYRDASFLDDRMFEHQRSSHLLPWADVAGSAPAGVPTDARWIFHIGHVGSTLIARLLGELDSVLSIREPRALRDLTFFPPETRAQFIPILLALFSRTFHADQSAMLKATSVVSEIAAELVPASERALFLYAKPPAYIAGILAGENSRKELAALAGMRAQRLSGRGIRLPQPRSEAHYAAAAWACEMTSLEAAADRMETVHWADFDAVLADLERHLQQMTNFFGFGASPERLAEIAASPLIHRYSKATEYDYSPQLRQELLAEAYASHRSDIESALAMLATASETAPLLRRALERARAES